MSLAGEMIPIVNMQDEIIWYKDRGEITPDDVYRVSSCWIKNNKDQVLLGQRALTKKHSPGIWSPIVNGTVGKDETYLGNILKEIEEEIWLQVCEEDFSLVKKFYSDNYRKKFVSFFVYIWDGHLNDLSLDKNEIAAIKRMDMKVFRQEVAVYPEKYFGSAKWCWENL